MEKKLKFILVLMVFSLLISFQFTIGDANTLDRSKVGISVGEIYYAEVVEYSVSSFEDNFDDSLMSVPQVGDIFVTFEIISIDANSGEYHVNMTSDSMDDFSEDNLNYLDDFEDYLFVYTDWEYWHTYLTDELNSSNDPYDNREYLLIDNSNEFGLRTTGTEEIDYYPYNTTSVSYLEEYLFDKSTGAIKKVLLSGEYTFENGTSEKFAQHFRIYKNSPDESLELPGFNFLGVFIMTSTLVIIRKKMKNYNM